MKSKLRLSTFYGVCGVSMLILAATQIGCATNQAREEEKRLDEGEKILSSSNGSLEFPEWAYSKTRTVDEGKLFVSGNVDVDSSHSASRCLMAADMVARANLVKELKSRVQEQAQYAAEGMEMDQHSLYTIINQSTEPQRIVGSFVAERWYGKIKSQSTNSTQLRYHCFSRMALPLELFKLQLNQVLAGSGRDLSRDFRDKMNKSWDMFFRADNPTPVEEITALPKRKSAPSSPFITPTADPANSKSEMADDEAGNEASNDADGGLISENRSVEERLPKKPKLAKRK